MSRIYVQTDGVPACGRIAACSGATMLTDAIQSAMVVGGTAGTAEQTVQLPTGNVYRGVMVVESPAVGKEVWEAGPWVTRFNITTAGNDTVMREIHVCRVNASCGTVHSVASETGLAISIASGGLFSRTITGIESTGSVDDRIYTVLVCSNTNTHTTRPVGITPDQSLDTPIVDLVEVPLPEASATSSTQVLTPDVAGPVEPIVVALPIAGAAASAGSQLGIAKRVLVSAATAAALVLTPSLSTQPVTVDLPVASATAEAGGQIGVQHVLSLASATSSAETLTSTTQVVVSVPIAEAVGSAEELAPHLQALAELPVAGASATTEALIPHLQVITSLPLASAEATPQDLLQPNEVALPVAGAQATTQPVTPVLAGQIIVSLPIAGASAEAGGQLGHAKRLSTASAAATAQDFDQTRDVNLPVAGAVAAAGGSIGVLHTLEAVGASAEAQTITAVVTGQVNVSLPIAEATSAADRLTPKRTLTLATAEAQTRALTLSTASVVTLPVASADAQTQELTARTEVVAELPVADASASAEPLLSATESLVALPVAQAAATVEPLVKTVTVHLPVAVAAASSLRVGIVRLLPVAQALASSAPLTSHISPRALLPAARADSLAKAIAGSGQGIWINRSTSDSEWQTSDDPSDSVWEDR